MSAFVGLLASEAASTLATPVVSRLLDYIPDPEKRAQEAASAATALLAVDETLLKQQNDINMQEAKSESLFVSGWRPFIGWCCGAALLWQILLAPFVKFNCAVFGYNPVLPPLSDNWMITILAPLLGFGVMRSFEKVQRVAGPLMGTPKPATPAAAAPAAAPDIVMRQAALTNVLARTPVPPASPAVTRPAGTDTLGTTRDVFARTLWGEARNQGQRGMEAVANVICRRAENPRWWGKDIRSVCLAHAQFSCWLQNNNNRHEMEAVNETDAEFAMALDIAERGIAKALTDHTNLADHYADLDSVHPIWADARRQTATVGRHTFFRLEV